MDLEFNAKKNIFECEYCGNKYTLKELENAKEKYHVKENYEKLDPMKGYRCSNCGAEIITGENTSSTSCVYCKNTALIWDRLTDIYAPSKIITFNYEKDDAIEAFKNICKKRPLIPKDFNNVKNIQDMEGLYVPFWLFDFKNDANMLAKCTKVTSWSDSKYHYTKTDHYEVTSGGKLEFDRVPADGASRFDDTIMNAIEPFDYKEFKDFNMSYLSGYISEKYDVGKDDSLVVATNRVKKDSKDYLSDKITGYSTKVIQNYEDNVSLEKTDYVLLPVYVLNIKFKDKIYHFAYNGQTGKMVGEIPVDKKKLIIAIIISFIIPFLVGLLFSKLGGCVW